jgi:VanZ family protein
VRALIATLAGTALAGGMETAQFFDVGRVTSLGDVYANGIGAGIGAVAAALWWPLAGKFAGDRSAVRSGARP